MVPVWWCHFSRPITRPRLFPYVSLCAATGAGGLFTYSASCEDEPRLFFRDELERLRPDEAAMRARWAQDGEAFKKLPPRAWPPVQPKADAVPGLRSFLDSERCPPAGASMSLECAKATFELATALLFNQLDPGTGLTLIREMAEAGDTDATVMMGVCIGEGIGVARDDVAGAAFLRRASDLGSLQGHYELGTLYYTGLNDDVEEDVIRAFKLYEKAAEQGHASSMFIVADCLLEGCGCERDAARAVPLLLGAADKGHRGARQYLLQLLAGFWPGPGNVPIPSDV